MRLPPLKNTQLIGLTPRQIDELRRGAIVFAPVATKNIAGGEKKRRNKGPCKGHIVGIVQVYRPTPLPWPGIPGTRPVNPRP